MTPKARKLDVLPVEEVCKKRGAREKKRANNTIHNITQKATVLLRGGVQNVDDDGYYYYLSPALWSIAQHAVVIPALLAFLSCVWDTITIRKHTGKP